MKLGIFTRTYERPTVEEVFAAAAADGMAVVQFNFVSAGLPSMPDSIDPAVVRRVRAAAEVHAIEIASISATFNLIHPDPTVRAVGLRRLEVLASVSDALGSRVLSLCTGTRDPDNMWRHHPSNDEPDAWEDLLDGIGRAVAVAGKHGLRLGIEPEPGNVVSNAGRAKRLLDEAGSPLLGIVLDPANLIEGIAADQVEAVIAEGVALLGNRTIIAHGKDRGADGSVQPPGQGIVPWPRFLAGLQGAGFSGPLILHGPPESAIPTSAAYLCDVLTQPRAG